MRDKPPTGMNVSKPPSAAKKAASAVSVPIMRVQRGTHHDPFEVLGTHTQADGSLL